MQLGGAVPALALLLPPPPPAVPRHYAAWCASAFFSPTELAARSEATHFWHPAARAGGGHVLGISPPGQIRSNSGSVARVARSTLGRPAPREGECAAACAGAQDDRRAAASADWPVGLAGASYDSGDAARAAADAALGGGSGGTGGGGHEANSERAAASAPQAGTGACGCAAGAGAPHCDQRAAAARGAALGVHGAAAGGGAPERSAAAGGEGAARPAGNVAPAESAPQLRRAGVQRKRNAPTPAAAGPHLVAKRRLFETGPIMRHEWL